MASIEYYNGNDYNYLFRQALLKAKNKGLLNVPENVIEDICNGVDIENIYSLFLSVYTDTLAEYYKDAQKIYEANDLNKATGNDLDIIGQKLGLSRYDATKASTTLQFSTNDELTGTVDIPIGVEVTGQDGIIYATTEAFTLNQTTVSVSVGAMSKSKGSAARVKVGQLNQVVTPITGLNNISVVNTTPSYGGKDRESDDDYRERLQKWRYSEQKGNEYAFRNALDNLDGLDDYRLIPKWDGAGTVKVITIPGTATVRQSVYNTVISEAARFDEDVSVFGAVEYPVDVFCSINVDYDLINPYSLTEKQDIKNRTQQSIVDYVSNLGIGQDFIPFKLGVYINDTVPEVKDVKFTLPESPVVVDDESVIKLTNVNVVIE